MADIDDIPISDDDDSELDADSMSNREFDEIAFDVDNPLTSDYEFLGEETREIDGEEVLLIVPDAIANEDIFVAESDNLDAEEIEEIDNDSTAVAETIEDYDNTAVIPTIGAVTAGERVMVVLKNGIPTAMGSTGFGDDINLRVHEIEADYIKAETIEAERVRVNNLLANKADISSLTAEQIRVDNLLAGKASVSDLSAATGRIDDLEADHVSTADLEAANGKITNLETNALTANSAVIQDIQAETAKVENLTAESLSAATGYIAALKSASIEASDISADHATIAAIDSDYIKTSDLEAERAAIDNLLAEKADISDLTAATGRIDDLEADHVSTDDLEAEQIRVNNLLATKASVSDFTAEQARVNNLLAEKADISTLEAEYAHVTNGTIDNAKINHADVNGLNAEVADIADARISQATISQAQVQNLSADYAKITNGKINSALIDVAAIVDEQVFTVTGNKATIEEINADTITVRNLHTTNLVVDSAEGYVTIGNKRTPTKEALDELVGTLQNEIDGAVETFTSSAVPLLSNYPASDWQISGATAEEQRKAYAKHVGDICYVQNTASAQNGYAYRFAYDSTEQTFKWVLIKDSDVTKALGDISDLQTFESETNTWIEETDEGLRTIRENHTSLSGIVDKTLVSSTQLWFSKANTTAPNKPTAQVTSTSTAGNAWRTVVPAYNASYPNYFYCYQWKYADDTFGWSAVTLDIAMGESQAQARKGVSDAAAADGKATTAQNTANANIKSSVQLWFTKANNSAPSKPSSVISTNDAATGNAWNLAVPTYNASYPHYFYCYQQQKGDGTYQWTDVVYDRATTENQAVARAALPSSTFETFRTTTFKEIVDTVDEQSTSITTLTEKTSSLANPNLTPWFSAQNSAYWNTGFSVDYDYATGHGHASGTEGSKDVTYLNDGWTHVILDSRASAGNENKSSYINTWVNRNQLGDITPGGTYTWLIEVRNLSITKDTLRVRPSIGNATLDIFSEVPVNTTDSGCAFSEDGAKWIQVTAKSDLSNVTRDTRGYIYVITDVYVEADVRVSLYEGEYSGPYKPYVERLENITEISNTVNTVKQTADTNTASITNLTKTVSDNKTSIEQRASTIEQNLSGITTRVSSTETNIAKETRQRKGTYAECTTDATTVNKAATISPAVSDFELYPGATVTVCFTKGNNVASPKLNVNNTGLYPIVVTGSAAPSLEAVKWSAYATAMFTFDIRNQWRLVSVDEDVRRLTNAETKIEQNAEAITLRATKVEMGQMNLSPFFQSVPFGVSSDNPYWVSNFTTNAFTALDDGWAHFHRDNTAGTSVSSNYVRMVKCPSVVDGDEYTCLVEIRNIVTNTATSYTIYTQQSSDAQFWGSNNYDGWQLANAALEEKAYYFSCTARGVSAHSTSGKHLMYINWQVPAGAEIECDIRISLYAGEYEGPYKPYTGSQLYASQAQLKVANDAINLRVEKNDVINQINVSTEGAKIEASKVEINGTAIFSAIEDQLDDAYDTKGAASTAETNAKAYTDSVEIGGRNLLPTTEKLSGFTTNNSTISIVDGVATFPGTSTAWNYLHTPNIPFSAVDGNDITFSFEYKSDMAVYGYIVAEGTANNDDTRTKYKDHTFNWPAQSEWTKWSVTFKGMSLAYLSQGSGNVNYFHLGIYDRTDSSNFKVRFPKLEKGNKPTDWTPAPEDIDASIATVEQGLGGFDILWNRAEFATDTNAGGECYICAYDPTTATRSDANGWVMWNGTKRTITKGTFNPNKVLPYNIPIYIVCRLSSATATTGTNYMVWYDTGNSKWRSGPMSPAASTLADWTWAETTDMILGKFVEPGSEVAFTECETYRQPLKWGSITTDTVTARSANAIASAAQTTANNAAPKANAIARSQRIYYRATSASGKPAKNETWLAASGTGYGNWSLNIPKLTLVSGSTETKYPFLYTAVQTQTVAQQAAGTTCSCTPVLIDETTTVIDGATVITGSVHSNSLDSDSVKANIVQTTDLSASKITSGDIATARMSANVVKAVQAKVSDLYALVAKIGGFVINATSIFSGTAVTSNADNSVALSTEDFTRTINNTSRAGLRFAIGDKFGVTGDGTLYANGANITSINASNISSGSINADRIKANVISAVNNGTGIINADKINVSAIKIGDLTGSIGGRNLLLQTGSIFPRSGTSSGYFIEFTVNNGLLKNAYELEEGVEYTFSADVTSSRNDFQITVGCGSGGFSKDIASKYGLSSGYVSITFTPTAAQLASGKIFAFRAPRYSSQGTSFTYSVDNVKLEKGGKATDWTPAPEDISQMVKINLAVRNFTTAQWKSFGAVGHVENWTTGGSYDNGHIHVGDTAYLVGTVTDGVKGTATIIGTVTAVNGTNGTTSVTMSSTQLIFGGDSVDSASKTATTYIADIAGGVKIHPSGDENTGVWITEDVDIVRDGVSVAMFGTDENNQPIARIGREDKAHTEQTDDTFYVCYPDPSDNTNDYRPIYLKNTTHILKPTASDDDPFKYRSTSELKLGSNDANGFISMLPTLIRTRSTEYGQSRFVIMASSDDHYDNPSIELHASGYLDPDKVYSYDGYIKLYVPYENNGSNNGYLFLESNARVINFLNATINAAYINPTNPLEATAIPNLDASKITGGTLNAARIPNLDASKITGGTFDAARVPSLDASKINAGTFDAARIPSLNASKITAGTFNAARIPNLNASKINAGTFDSARLPTISIDKGGTGDTGVETVTAQATIFTSVTSGMTISSLTCATWGKMCMLSFVVKPSAAQTSAFVIGTLATDYRPVATCTANPYHSSVATARILTNGTIQMTAAPANEIPVSFTYLLA